MAQKKVTRRITIEKERSEFKQLLLKNPNHFGTLADSPLEAVKKIAGNTKYEELTCIGFNPAHDLLEATVQIKLPYGYGGNLCAAGSTEYVRFFVDYGGGWEDLGVAGFSIHDLPDGTDCADKPNKPLTYVVTMPVDPKRNFCGTPVMPKVRGVLSWNVMPSTDPVEPPVWGNVLDRHIQIRPRPKLLLDVMDVIAVELGKKIDIPEAFKHLEKIPIPEPGPPPVELADLAKMYATAAKGKATKGAAAKMEVEPHRFGFSQIVTALESPAVEPMAVTAKIAAWKELGLDWAEAVTAVEKTKGNTSYEELTCIGLDPNREWLVGTFLVKRPSGYSGNLCGPGSTEHVAFWADWDDTCEWTYLGHAEVQVHDISGLPAGGLCYTAILPVDLDTVRQPCARPKIGRVRAVLSWASPPSTTDPDAIPYWGNRLDTHVQIRPGVPDDELTAKIRSLGGINVEDIHPGTGLTIPTAKFWYYETPADPWGLSRPCPFGGLVVIEGKYHPGYYYRIAKRRVSDPPGAYTYVTNSFNVRRADVGSDPQVADPATGFFTYKNPLLYLDTRLALWHTAGDELWAVRIEIADSLVPFPNIIAVSPEYLIQLDNTAPMTAPPLASPNIDIHIDSGGDCKDFIEGDTIAGHFVARDVHFGAFSLTTMPNTATFPSNKPTTPQPSTSQTPASPGSQWFLDTDSPKTMKPCGYVVHLRVWDRSIVNSHPGSHNSNHIEVGFCLRAET
ncbi:MAG TPA: hypothetical protein VLT32_12105 [Candidatus Sulfomarinibacteraceae bacterium]|nr:hypothetical protein [Candidatus Sulfomarinibacteraceae bacterium]